MAVPSGGGPLKMSSKSSEHLSILNEPRRAGDLTPGSDSKFLGDLPPKSPFWRDKASRDYESPVLENPTWTELLPIAIDQINHTHDYAHVVLEGIRKRYRKDGITYCSLILGS